MLEREEIHKPLDNAIARGLMERRDSGDIYMRMLGWQDNPEKTIFCVSPPEGEKMSSRQLRDFNAKFLKMIGMFSKGGEPVFHAPRIIKSGPTRTRYQTLTLSFETPGAVGLINVYPNSIHVDALAEAHNLEVLKNSIETNRWRRRKDIRRIRKIYPK